MKWATWIRTQYNVTRNLHSKLVCIKETPWIFKNYPCCFFLHHSQTLIHTDFTSKIFFQLCSSNFHSFTSLDQVFFMYFPSFFFLKIKLMFYLFILKLIHQPAKLVLLLSWCYQNRKYLSTNTRLMNKLGVVVKQHKQKRQRKSRKHIYSLTLHLNN